MKLHQLRALIVVSQKGSILEASRALHLTQPAVSKALSDLELEVGAPLLIRSARGVQPTSYGQALVRHARAIEQQLHHAIEDIDSLRGIARGTVTVGVTPVTCGGPFADALRHFMRLHPEVTIAVREMRTPAIYDSLTDGSIDFGLVSPVDSPTDRPRFHWEPLYTIPTAIAVRIDHPLADTSIPLGTLQDQTWISWDALDDATSLIGALFAENDIKPPARLMRCTSMELYFEMATTTDLVSLTSTIVFHVHGHRAKLRAVQLEEVLPKLKIGLVCRDIDFLTTTSQALIDLIRHYSNNLKGPYLEAGAAPCDPA